VVEGTSSSASATVGPFSIAEVPALRLGAFTVTPIGGDGDGFLDPGEGATLSVQLINDGTNTATNVRAGLSTSTAGVVVSENFSEYLDIAPSANRTNVTPYVFYVPPNFGCGQTIQLALVATGEGNGSASVGEYNFSVSVGQPTFSNATASYTGPAVTIPDENTAGVNVPLTVSGVTGQIEDLNFRIDGTTCNSTTTVGINHTFVSDLSATVRSPAGTARNLFQFVGGGGDNFCQTVLDDQAATSIQSVTSANAPFTGTFRPNRVLSLFRGENPNGVWTFNVMDNVATDVGSVRAFSLLFTIAQYSCNAAPADTTAPSCTPTDFRPGPPASADLTTQDTGTGIASIHVRNTENVDVLVPPFTAGTTTPIVVSGTLIDPNLDGFFEIETVDVAGNISTCSRTITVSSGPPAILSDNFDDDSIDATKWNTQDMFTMWTNLGVPITETAQQLRIGPLLQIPATAHRGVVTVNQFNFSGANSYVELVQAPSSTTDAQASFAVGNNPNRPDLSQARFYRIYVKHGSLFGERRTSGTVNTTLFSIPYDPVAHRFWRIRHNAGMVTLDTATGTGGVPGTWVQRYTETWQSVIPLTSVLMEFRAGTSKQETNPGTVIFDNFVFALNSP
jgi:subtilisin-like proprotein convertase family protein